MIDTVKSTGTQLFGPGFFKTPTLLDEFVLIKIGSQIALTTGHIPHLALLHRWMPNFFDSPLCPVCLVTNDSADHLLFYCPVKQTVWQGMIFEFLWPTTTISDIKSALSSLDFSPLWYCQKEGITPLEITIITLSQIWLAHIRFVFDKTPISHSAIMASIRLNVQKNIDQDSVHSLL